MYSSSRRDPDHLLSCSAIWKLPSGPEIDLWAPSILLLGNMEYLSILYELLLEAFESLREHILGHLKSEGAEVITEPCAGIEHGEPLEVLEGLKGLLHAHISEMFWNICEVIIIRIKFWIFPGILIFRISRAWLGLWCISISIIGCLFLRIWEDCVGFWDLSELFFGLFLIIDVFVLTSLFDTGWKRNANFL